MAPLRRIHAEGRTCRTTTCSITAPPARDSLTTHTGESDHLTLRGSSITPTAGGAGLVPMAEPIAVDTGAPGTPSRSRRTQKDRARSRNPNGYAAAVAAAPGSPAAVPQVLQPVASRRLLPALVPAAEELPRVPGTLRVDRTGATPIVSGDLYRFLLLPPVFTETVTTVATTRALGDTERPKRDTTPAVGSVSEAISAGLSLFTKPLGIPIYPRNQYHSYLKGTALSVPVFSFGTCAVTITMQEYVYTQPAVGQLTAPSPPRRARARSSSCYPCSGTAGYPSVYFEGRLYENNVDKGHITLGWVSQYFRRATIEIDTVAGAVSPQAVGTESLRTIYGRPGGTSTSRRTRPTSPSRRG